MQHLHAELYRTDTMTILGLHVAFVLVIFRCILLHVNVGSLYSDNFGFIDV